VCSPFACIKVLGTESSPLLAAVMTAINFSSVWKSSCHVAWARLRDLVAALAARFALNSVNQLICKEYPRWVTERENPQIALRVFAILQFTDCVKSINECLVGCHFLIHSSLISELPAKASGLSFTCVWL
jgi:hypothetical protein